MSATDELRRLLDERGIEHMDFNMPERSLTLFAGDEHDGSYAENSVDTILTVYGASPEQAVDTTLGRGTCRDMDVGGYFVCSECDALVKLHSIGRSYVDEWGKRWYSTSNEHGFNYCPNCGRRIEVDA